MWVSKELKTALKLWEDGRFSQAHTAAEDILQSEPGDGRARFLKMKVLFVQGRYKEALNTFDLIDTGFKDYPQATELAAEAYVHLGDYAAASEIVRGSKNSRSLHSLYQELKDSPFSVEASQTHIVPFLDDPQLPSLYWPGVAGTLNGHKASIRFDTGGTFLVIGKAAAEKYGVPLKYEDKGMHGSSTVKLWHSLAKSMDFEGGPSFANVPVTVMESLGEYVIFGTNILEQFLATMDYPNDRFVLTPRSRPELFDSHNAMLPPDTGAVPFYLWGDHYMIAKGKFGEWGDLSLFFDSGLIALTQIDGQMAQASFHASKETLLKWGFDKSKMKETTFFPTEHSLEVAGLSQPNTLVWYDQNLPKDRVFGGVRIDGLISHGCLRNYCWTIDFDRMEYRFAARLG